MKRALLGLVVSGILLSLASSASSEEATYRKQIKPLFDAKCAACHGSESAPEFVAYKEAADKWKSRDQGARMDTYSHLVYYTAWPNTGALMRRLDDGKGGSGGKAGNMYEYLGGTEEERQRNLSLFKEWVGNWTLKRWREITKEDLNGIKVKY